MPSNLVSSLDMTELAKGLPSLICETNIENQVANIEKWLKPFIPVNGIGLALSGFSEHDKRILMGIADEVGLAVKNARMFDYVVNSYCKIRQGQMSCKGCVRPLKSWTPCARQLDVV